MSLNQTRSWAVGFPRHLSPPENQGVVHHDDIFRNGVVGIGNTGAPNILVPTVSQNIAPDSSFFVFLNQRHSGTMELNFVGSIKTSAHGVTAVLAHDNCIPLNLPAFAGAVSMNMIGVHTTSQTAQVFNLTVGNGIGGRGVSLSANLKPKIIAGLEGVGPSPVSHVADESEFEFATFSFDVPLLVNF